MQNLETKLIGGGVYNNANEDQTSAERLAQCPSNFVDGVTGGRSGWSWLGSWFTDPGGNFADLSKAIVSGFSCVGINLFIPTEAELEQIMSESAECEARVTGELGDDLTEELEEHLAAGGASCTLNDLWGTVYSDIQQASSGAWPRCKQAFVDMEGFAELELNKQILDRNEDGTIQNSEGEDFDTIENVFVIDACTTNGEDSILKSSSGIIRPIASVGLLLLLFFILPKLIMYALTLDSRGTKI